MSPGIALRDVHQGTAPALWPPAPGWWMVVLVIAIVAALAAWRIERRRRRRAAILHLFDDALAHAQTPAQQVAAMSELLRRAAKRIEPGADALDGDAWLQFLDRGLEEPAFSGGAGRLLLDGGFRAEVAARDAEALRVVARQRYLAWMRAG